MYKLIGTGVALILCCTPYSAYAVSYDFCVQRQTAAKLDNIHAQITFGTVDPGKEAARVIVMSKYKSADATSVSVNDYDSSRCGGPSTDEFTVTASAEQLQSLASQVGNADPSAVVTAGEIATGVTVQTVKTAGTVLQSVGNAVVHVFQHIF